jgi:hypothetical protein
VSTIETVSPLEGDSSTKKNQRGYLDVSETNQSFSLMNRSRSYGHWAGNNGQPRKSSAATHPSDHISMAVVYLYFKLRPVFCHNKTDGRILSPVTTCKEKDTREKINTAVKASAYKMLG